MAYTRADIRTDVRDEIYEATADLISDAVMNRHISKEIRSLPRKNIYIEEIWTFNTVAFQQDYTLPTGTYKVEKLERNWGTTAIPIWEEQKGWDNYAGAIWLGELPTIVWPGRVYLRKAFTVLTDDVTASDIPDEKMEVVILGTTARCYRSILGYLKDAKNWDAIAKPSGVNLGMIHQLYREIKEDYRSAVQKYQTYPLPRDINLVE